MKYASFFIIITGLTLISCKGTSNQQAQNVSNKPITEEDLIQINKNAVRAENEKIESFIKSKRWKMTPTGTGLRYMILNETDTNLPLAQVKQEALINAQVSLMDGTLVYTTDQEGPQWFKIGMSDVESGLHEGILLMRVGDKARFVMPPHLAHGLLGDLQAIPPKSTIIYDVELVQLK
tara:strand:+ start:1226 stop:1759 length:534 start_codon:yes stop_codon:yes gene_type:complete